MSTYERATKPLNQKAYGSVPHLIGSRAGPGEHFITPGQTAICCERTRDANDTVIVEEKLDGTCVAVARINGDIVPLGRAGYPALSSPHEQHHLFHHWAMANKERFLTLLRDGERAVGEWLAQAHGTRYDLKHEPWVLFDIMVGHDRATAFAISERNVGHLFIRPRLISAAPTSIATVLELIQVSGHGAIDPVEGAVWRVERNGVVDYLAKYVLPSKKDGIYLPEISKQAPVWNWRPS